MKKIPWSHASRTVVPTFLMLAAVPFCSQATDFLNPPGAYDYTYWFASNASVPTGVTRPDYTTGTSAIRLGPDYVFKGSATEVIWAHNLPSTAYGYRSGNDEAGVLVYKASTALKGCAANSCTITVSAAAQSCRNIQLTWGFDAKGSFPSVGDVTFKYQNQTTAQACLTETDSYAFTVGTTSSSYYLQAVNGMEYRYARVKVKPNSIIFTQAVADLAVTDSKMKAAHKLCLSQGWESSSSQRNDIAYFRQTMRVNNYNRCYVPNATLQYYAYGPHPEDGVYSLTITNSPVKAGDFITTYSDVDI